jgi:hypothetical protein
MEPFTEAKTYRKQLTRRLAAALSVALAVFAAGTPKALSQASTATAPLPPCGRQVIVSSVVPTDECGGAFKNSPDQAALFAWNAFIALNWPAAANKRDTPDTNKPFGADVTPLVWETMRNKVEIYPGNGKQTVGPHGATIAAQSPFNATNPPDFGYDEASDYVYAPSAVGIGDGRIAACAGQTPPAQPSWISLDETTQIKVNQTFAGILPATDPTGPNSAPQLIRYMIKANRALYQNVVGNQFWYKGVPLNTAILNFRTALSKGQAANPAVPFVEFPPQLPATSVAAGNAIELKGAWRPLTAAEKASGRFHSATVRYYEFNAAGVPCYREDVWGLIGLHIIQKTPSAPWFIWATFEQADNILDQNGKPVEDVDGNVVNAQSSPTTPALKLIPASAGKEPSVVFSDSQAPYCADPGGRLFFHESQGEPNLPSAGNICVNQRWHNISPYVVSINQLAHETIKDYVGKHGMSNSPWLYYKLVNVQPVPFDKSEINSGSNDSAIYYTANAVIETDYTLGNYSGQIAPSGAPTDFAPDGTTPFENIVFLPFQGSGAFPTPLNMGGCTGCHASSALRGTDFSFSLVQSTVRSPEPTQPFQSTNFLLRDRSLFAPLQ